MTRMNVSYHRNQKLKKRYNIDIEEYERMLTSQGGGCAICGSPPAEGDVLRVDHCHDSNQVRGLLCHSCNVGLGNFKDDTTRLVRAIQYLNTREK